MIYGIFVFFHIIACLVLIIVILLQSGRGGGLSEMAGGTGAQQTQKLFGTQTNALLMKFTSYCAIAFLITSISLVLLTSRRSKSLMEGAQIKPIFNTENDLAKNGLPVGPDGKTIDKKQLEEMIKKLAAQAKAADAPKTGVAPVAVSAEAPKTEAPSSSAAVAKSADSGTPVSTPSGDDKD